MLRKEETICAPATGQGGAISVIRVSGKNAIAICDNIFFPSESEKPLATRKGYSLVFGEIREGNNVIDEVLVSLFREPHSYTGEDSVEISCHASPYIRKKITGLLINCGATIAQPGEFTRRAFLNGKLDLVQAEAVADIIASSTQRAHKLALNQMRGGFSAQIALLRKELLDFSSLIELELDFGEEDVEFASRTDLLGTVDRIKALATRLASSFSTGNAIRNGIPVVIAGRPNSGKSTLLNALIMEEKAIVSDIPGTTRDFIEDTLSIDGLQFRFIDTAGLRETNDMIESLGIRKTHEKIEEASVVLLVDDVTETTESINKRLEALREMTKSKDKKIMLLINKSDLAANDEKELMSGRLRLEGKEELLFISSKYMTGLEELRQRLSDTVIKEDFADDAIIISGMRHYEALGNVASSIERVKTGLEEGIPDDLIATDIRQAIHYLGEITGEITTDEVLGNIFKNFCIGK